MVTNAGPFGLTDSLPGDSWGDFNNNLRGQDNRWEGIYLDDFIIGFAERGEMVINASGNTELLRESGGARQPDSDAVPTSWRFVRVREVWRVPARAGSAESCTGASTRMTACQQSHSLIASPANEISDGQTFTLSDGLNSLTFEFDDVTINDGVTPGTRAHCL